MKVANRNARQYVQRLHPFEGRNLYGTFFCTNPSSAALGDSGYVVYSYGQHWPLFINVCDQWFENRDRHSVTTSKHRSQTHPHRPTILLSTEWMKKLAQGGYQALVKARVIEGVAL